MKDIIPAALPLVVVFAIWAITLYIILNTRYERMLNAFEWLEQALGVM